MDEIIYNAQSLIIWKRSSRYYLIFDVGGTPTHNARRRNNNSPSEVRIQC